MKKIGLLIILSAILLLSGCDIFINRHKALGGILSSLDTILLAEQKLLDAYQENLINPNTFIGNPEAKMEFFQFTINGFRENLDKIDNFIQKGDFASDQKEIVERNYPAYKAYANEYFLALDEFKLTLNDFVKEPTPEKQQAAFEKLHELKQKSIKFFEIHNDFMSDILSLEFGVKVLKIKESSNND